MTQLRALLAAALWLVALPTIGQPAGLVVGTSGTNEVMIDLPTTLRLAGAQNLEIQAAREKLSEARAENQSALLRFFPWVSAAVTYDRHDGQVQSTEGALETVSKQAYTPGGALVSELDLGKAIYHKLAAKQQERAASQAFEGQRQESVLLAAKAYFDLAFAQASIGVAREAVRIATNYEAQVGRAVKVGFGLRGDLLRVSVEAERDRMTWRQTVEQRQEFGVGVVLEHILAEQDLTRARTDHLKAVAEFNQAQYELARAVGALSAAPPLKILPRPADRASESHQ